MGKVIIKKMSDCSIYTEALLQRGGRAGEKKFLWKRGGRCGVAFIQTIVPAVGVEDINGATA